MISTAQWSEFKQCDGKYKDGDKTTSSTTATSFAITIIIRKIALNDFRVSGVTDVSDLVGVMTYRFLVCCRLSSFVIEGMTYMLHYRIAGDAPTAS